MYKHIAETLCEEFDEEEVAIYVASGRALEVSKQVMNELAEQPDEELEKIEE